MGRKQSLKDAVPLKGRWRIIGEDWSGVEFGLGHFETREAAEAELARIEGDWDFPIWVDDFSGKRFQVFVVEEEEPFLY